MSCSAEDWASELIVTHGPGSFMGELAQLSGRPSLVGRRGARERGRERCSFRRERLRDFWSQEAELGERIMRALILRRVGCSRPAPAGR